MYAEVTGSMRMLEELLKHATEAICHAADESIGIATKAMELSCSSMALDRGYSREHDSAGRSSTMGSETYVAKENSTAVPAAVSTMDIVPYEGKVAPVVADDPPPPKNNEPVEPEPECPGRPCVKKKHVDLRVRNLEHLNNLNKEVLELQLQLRSLFGHSEGELLPPAVSLAHKSGLFETVKELLNSGLSEARRLAAESSSTAPAKVLERAFAFALALEHAKEVALPAEVRTQVLKLAALVDMDLLCQIITGPFKGRLLSLGGAGSSRRAASPAGAVIRRSSSNLCARTQSAWDTAVHEFSSRIVRCLRDPMLDAQGNLASATE